MGNKVPNSIDGKTMKTIMNFIKNTTNTLLRVPIFYNDKIYVTNGKEGLVFKNPMICDLPKDIPYTPDLDAFKKILISNEYYIANIAADGGPEFSVYTKNGIEHHDMKSNDIYLSVIKELDDIVNGSIDEPTTAHPKILGAPAESVGYVMDYANACGFYAVNSSLRWSGALPYYLYTFPLATNDTYAFVCAYIDKNTL